MDTDLKCNRLTCRHPLTDKAVVVSLSYCLGIGTLVVLPSDVQNSQFRTDHM